MGFEKKIKEERRGASSESELSVFAGRNGEEDKIMVST
jgi:hypothetical protein